MAKAAAALSKEREFQVREAKNQDRQSLASLIHFEMRVHRHLDWRSPLDWLGTQPYLVGEIQGNVRTALVCPPDPPEVAWIRLFAVASAISTVQAWKALWPVALEQLSSHKLTVAAIPTERWFCRVLEDHGFTHWQNIVSLRWVASDYLQSPMSKIGIRAMMFDDLPAVIALDAAAFGPLWRNSADALEFAFRQAVLATVALDDGQIAGYQISTAGPLGGHLARLAVHPAWQGQGVGSALVCDTLEQFTGNGVRQVSVNTQADNSASLNLYRKFGFERTGEIFPVYRLN